MTATTRLRGPITNITRGGYCRLKLSSVPGVTGTLVDQDGAPVPSTPISLLAIDVFDQDQLGTETTAQSGDYCITHDRPKSFSLAVRAKDANGETIDMVRATLKLLQTEQRGGALSEMTSLCSTKGFARRFG